MYPVDKDQSFKRFEWAEEPKKQKYDRCLTAKIGSRPDNIQREIQAAQPTKQRDFSLKIGGDVYVPLKKRPESAIKISSRHCQDNGIF